MGILEFPVELNLKDLYSLSMFDELTKEIAKDLEAIESRQRPRRDDAQAAFPSHSLYVNFAQNFVTKIFSTTIIFR